MNCKGWKLTWKPNFKFAEVPPSPFGRWMALSGTERAFTPLALTLFMSLFEGALGIVASLWRNGSIIRSSLRLMCPVLHSHCTSLTFNVPKFFFFLKPHNFLLYVFCSWRNKPIQRNNKYIWCCCFLKCCWMCIQVWCDKDFLYIFLLSCYMCHFFLEALELLPNILHL